MSLYNPDPYHPDYYERQSEQARADRGEPRYLIPTGPRRALEHKDDLEDERRKARAEALVRSWRRTRMASAFEKWMEDLNDAQKAVGALKPVNPRLHRLTWLAALRAVEEQMPSASFDMSIKQTDGWNRCLSTMSERIAALKEDSDV